MEATMDDRLWTVLEADHGHRWTVRDLLKVMGTLQDRHSQAIPSMVGDHQWIVNDRCRTITPRLRHKQVTLRAAGGLLLIARGRRKGTDTPSRSNNMDMVMMPSADRLLWRMGGALCRMGSVIRVSDHTGSQTGVCRHHLSERDSAVYRGAIQCRMLTRP